ncbi:FxsC-like protein [Streptomyces sp. 1114.5]|uniref:TIR-like protein FxsC n=1 Tax=Streptomyces sp. 1114.5 TaxID=1938830 RepID=UPI000EAE9D9D|nr:TIR-like protein FxsC [Streptomyces sp. 1114.5]RKT16371.1 FxsC-like protein [Streptomyces sp. 1114.5]
MDQEHQRPYFFFSYARRDYEAEDAFVNQFFNDLRDELGRLVGMGVRVEELAYRDTEQLRLGDDWAEKLAAMLARSRTMVALYSPAYFASLYCGKEWTAFRGRVRRHHEHTGELISALVPVLWEPVVPGELADEVSKIQWAQPDMGEAYARYGLRALLRTAQGEAYEQVVRVVAERVREAAARRLGELPEFDLGAVRGYFPPPAAPEAVSAPGMVRLFIAAGRASEAAAEGGSQTGGWYGAKPWHWAPYHPPIQPSLAARAQQVITAAGHTTTLEEVDSGLGGKLDQAREDSQVSVLLVDPWVAGAERYSSALREYDDQNHPVTGVMVPSGSADPPDGPGRDALWAGVRDVFRRNWLRRSDMEHLFRVKVSRESFDNELTIMVTVAQNKLMDDNLDWGDDGGDAFGLGPGGAPAMPGLSIPAGPPGPRQGPPARLDPGRGRTHLPHQSRGKDNAVPLRGDTDDDH